MRLADVEPATIVRFGSPRDLQFPRIVNGNRISASCPALVVAVGKFTLTSSGHCGETMPAVLEKGRNAVLILRQPETGYRRRGTGMTFQPITRDTTWRWDVVSPNYLMSMEEWNLKTFPLFELQTEMEVWQKRYNELKKGVSDIGTEKLKKKLAAILGEDGGLSAGVSFSKLQPDDGVVRLAVHFDVNETELRKLVGTKKIDELVEFAATKPNACSL